MKRNTIFTFPIVLYQILLSPLLHQLGAGGCRYPETCSSYAIRMIKEKGVIRGSVLALQRLSTCHPFAKRH